jgi:hypothetical protein
MATSSFRTTLEIKDDKTADAMIRAMKKPRAPLGAEREDFLEARERGKQLLKKQSSH